MERSNLLEKEFRIMTVNMIQDLGKRMEKTFEKMQEMFTKDIKEPKKKPAEMITINCGKF